MNIEIVKLDENRITETKNLLKMILKFIENDIL
jgi:hypothetical protein